jgi:hypothetical protein
MEVETWNNLLKESKLSENLLYYRVGLPLPHHFIPTLSEVRIVQDFDSTHLLGIVQKMPLGCCLHNNIEVKKGFCRNYRFSKYHQTFNQRNLLSILAWIGKLKN